MDEYQLCEMLLKDTDYPVILDKLPKTREGIQMIINVSRLQIFYLDFNILSIILKLFNELDPYRYFKYDTITEFHSEFTSKINHSKDLQSLEYSCRDKVKLLKQLGNLQRTCDIFRKINESHVHDMGKMKILYFKALNDIKEKDKKWQDLIEIDKLKMETYYDSKIIEFKDNRKKIMERKQKDKEIIKSLSKCRDTQCKKIKTLTTQIENLQLELKEKDDIITRYITSNNDKDLNIQGLNGKLELLNEDILKSTKIKLNFKKKEKLITQLKTQIKKQKQQDDIIEKLSKEHQTAINTLHYKCIGYETENKNLYSKVLLFQKISENLKNSLLEYKKEENVIGCRWGEQWVDPYMYEYTPDWLPSV